MRARNRQRQSGNCPKCGVFREVLHRDHVIPKWQGGADEPSNWQLLCANCHEDKTLIENRSEAAREKRRLEHVGRKRSAETCAKLSAIRLGTKLSEETKAKIGAASRGRTFVMSAAGRENCRQAKIRLYQDRAAREKLSVIAKARCQTPEWRQKMSDITRQSWGPRRARELAVTVSATEPVKP